MKKPDSASLAAARIIKALQALVSIIFLAGSMICTFGNGRDGQCSFCFFPAQEF